MERKTTKEIKRHQVVAKAVANHAAAKQTKAERRAHEAAMAAHLAHHAMAATLAAGATLEDAIHEGQEASATPMGEERSTTMWE